MTENVGLAVAMIAACTAVAGTLLWLSVRRDRALLALAAPAAGVLAAGAVSIVYTLWKL